MDVASRGVWGLFDCVVPLGGQEQELVGRGQPSGMRGCSRGRQPELRQGGGGCSVGFPSHRGVVPEELTVSPETRQSL